MAHECIKTLREEHTQILSQLDALEVAVSGSAVNKEEVEKFLHFTENFAEPHHKKEEDVLFPALEAKGIPRDGGPTGVMLSEHQEKRNYVKGLRLALQNGDDKEMKRNGLSIVNLMRSHIDKENNILYPMAEQLLSAEDLAELAAKCECECHHHSH